MLSIASWLLIRQFTAEDYKNTRQIILEGYKKLRSVNYKTKLFIQFLKISILFFSMCKFQLQAVANKYLRVKIQYLMLSCRIL